ncbi:transcriptional regulator [Paenibacillus sp. LMG 31456]|uniref:Transcriptional regulator n=1 Tax=Paenibacillus foliorum TaxID=2654974 RepID=A0A972GYE4_9BACL|nr:ParB N-terminal domain-containing protein [Paenibacillus foliorum]NOU95175.1 transcriptional regulator [Paenibacillus foliorum]
MEIRKVHTSQINAASSNPRKDLQPSDSEYEKLKRSIEEFGYIDPVIWNELTGNLVGGHQRYKILLERGDMEIDVSVVQLELEQEKLLNLTLNKVSGAWDEEMLSRLLEELYAAGADLELSGFDGTEIDRLIQEFQEPPEEQLGNFTNREIKYR